MSTYATYEQLTARLSAGYTVTESDAAQMLVKASELIDYATQGRSEQYWSGTDYTADDYDGIRAEITRATCDQVEYWLETGEEHDVLGLRGSLQGGRVQIQRLPPYLGQRALRTLLRAGLYYAGAASQ